jgi:hypothetical protein
MRKKDKQKFKRSKMNDSYDRPDGSNMQVDGPRMRSKSDLDQEAIDESAAHLLSQLGGGGQ